MELVIFIQNNCKTCEELINTLNNIDFNIQLVDIKVDIEYAKKYSICVTPTTILIENGKEIDRFYGSKDIKYVNNFLKK